LNAFDEGRLWFEFGSAWDVRKWDGERAYREGIEKLSGSKALDFVGKLDRSLFLIEVKDFRDYRIENKKRLMHGELAIEVAQKVRDTLAGIVGVSGEGRTDCANWKPFLDAAVSQTVRVVLWLEHDPPSGKPKGTVDQMNNTLKQHLERNLRWLRPHVFVASLADKASLQDLHVRNL